MWNPQAPSKTEWTAGPIVPRDILYYLDGPAIFTAQLGLVLFLFYKVDELSDSNIFLVVDTNDEIVDSIRGLSLSLRGALSHKDCWIVEATRRLHVKRFWSVARSQIPADYLPERALGLAPTSAPLPDTLEQVRAFFSMTFRGEELREDAILFGRFKYLVDSAYDSIRKIFPAPIIEDRSIARNIDFPLFQPQLGSLVIAIQSPLIDEESINKKISYAISPEELNAAFELNRTEFFDNVESIVKNASKGKIDREFAIGNIYTLEQINNILPTSENYLDQVEFRGVGTITIDDRIGDRIRNAYRIAEAADRSVTGAIVEVNAESNTFVIKDHSQRQITCIVGWEAFEHYKFSLGMRVRLRGRYIRRRRRDLLHVRGEPNVF
jgi:hypothetical protein